MKSTLLFIFLILITPLVLAEEPTIYDLLTNIKSNPQQYMIVLGYSTDIKEIQVASELAGLLGITSSRFDSEVSRTNNLILIGSPSSNKITASLLGTTDLKETIVKSMNNNLILAGPSSKDTQKAISFLKNFEKYKSKLQTNEYKIGIFFAPSSEFKVIILAGAAVILLTIIFMSIFLIAKKIKNKRATVQEQVVQPIQVVSPQEQRLINYIKDNISKGYTKEQVYQELSKVGWKQDILQNIFSKL